MLAILGRAKVMIIKQLTALAVLALTLSGCAPLPIGTAAGGATALVVTDPHWCREHRYYRYDLEWHLHHCGGWCTVSRLWSLIAAGAENIATIAEKAICYAMLFRRPRRATIGGPPRR